MGDPQPETKMLTDEEKNSHTAKNKLQQKKPPVPSSNTWWYNPNTGKVELFWS